MCPSFQVTREEMHSTRGRANLLRAAYSGKLPTNEQTNQQLYEAMDLCIECKACKAECPSSVDMAKIKFEFLAQYYDAHGVPLRTRLFGDIGQLNRLSSGTLAPIANWSLQNGLIRAGMARFLGISTERQLPTFARIPFTKWFASRITHHASRKLVLFIDPFTNFTEPDIAQAAVAVLEAAGFAIEVVAGDDGRSAISKGLVDKARTRARETIEKLAPFAQQGIPIIGLEPSSLLSLRDEYLYLLKGDGRVQQIADHAYTFEEFIAKLADSGELNLPFTDEKRHILLHGHCHQKALVGTGPSQRILSLPPNYTVEEVDSGCCGMAGAFGYEVEHVAISRQMAERRLLPAVRAAANDTIIAAAGTSCRHQIMEGSNGRIARHPAEILRDALLKENN
jgi:Fe-S oxidoreductase